MILDEILAVAAQAAVFLVGLVISIVIGMALAAHFDGPGGLLFATCVAGTGLLTAAALSQMLRDHLVERSLEK
jgi:hypothetical protein